MNIVILTGEESGDLHGARLLKSFKEQNADVSCYALGSRHLKNAGAKIFFDSDLISVVGFTEIIPKMPTILKAIRLTKKTLKEIKPDILVLIDFPEFNLHIAKFAKKQNIRVLFYISPQIWAWRSYRVHKIKRLVDHVAVIFPFEEEFYKKYDVPATFVGHPLFNNEVFNADISYEKDENFFCIGLFPGSRKGEIIKHCSILLEAAKIIKEKSDKKIKFVVALAKQKDKKYIEDKIKKSGLDVQIVENGVNVYKMSHFAIVASGTATLEGALLNVPMLVIYKVSLISYLIAKSLITIKHISIVNIILKKEVIPELIQFDVNKEKIADEALKIINDDKRREEIIDNLKNLRKILGDKDASNNVVKIANKLIASK